MIPTPEADRERIDLHGRLDASSTSQLDTQLRSYYDEGAAEIDLDLGDVSYVSSSVLRILLLAHRRQQQRGGTLRLLHVPPRIMRILTLCGFDRVLDLVPEVKRPPSTTDHDQA